MAKQEVGDLHVHLNNSFANVRRDTSHLYDWVRYLYGRIEEHEQRSDVQQQTINALFERLNGVLTPESVNEIVSNHSSVSEIERLKQRIAHLHTKAEIAASLHDGHNSRIAEIQSRLEALRSVTDKKGTVLQQRLLKNIARNSKSYVKNSIVGVASRHGKISALQLKEIVVDEQRLCSKSTFYRLLAELESEDKLPLVKDGRQKLYVSGVLNDS